MSERLDDSSATGSTRRHPADGRDLAENPRQHDDSSDAELFARLAESTGPGVRAQSVERLVERYEWIVHWAATKYRDRGQPQEVLRQVGYLGLMEAIHRFDPHRGNEFAAFAIPTVLGEVRRYFRDSCRQIRLPRRLYELQKEIREAERVLTQDDGRLPTPAAIAAHLGIDPEDVVEVQVAYTWYAPCSLDAPVRSSGEDGLCWADTIGADDSRLELVVNLEALAHVVARLPERDRHLLALRFYEGKSQAEIGASLGVSQMHVSRLLSRILANLRAALERDEHGAEVVRHPRARPRVPAAGAARVTQERLVARDAAMI